MSDRQQAVRTTVACVIEHQGRYLMVKEDRGGMHTLYNQPAGHVEPGEGPKHAVLREVREETAWHVTLTGYLGLYIYRAPDGLTFHSHAFIARPEYPLPTPLDSDITAAHWLSLPELTRLERAGRLRSPLVRERIEDARHQPVYPLALIRE